MKRITQETVNRAIDYVTGEIKQESSSITYSLASEPDFVKLYLQDLLYLVGLPKYHLYTLFWLMCNSNYANAKYGQCVVLTSSLKEEIASEIGIKRVSSINSILTRLSKKRIIEHVGRSIYRLNPYLFGRGKWADIRGLQDVSSIDMRVRYSREGKEISAIIETNGREAFPMRSFAEKLGAELESMEQEEKKAI